MKKTYRVVGDSIVHGHTKGETFAADLEDAAERLLVEAGHVVVAGNKAKYETASVSEPVETADEKN